MKATVLFAKRNKILAVRGTESNEGLAMVLLAELMHLGFSLSQEAFETVKTMTKQAISDLYDELIPYIRTNIGANRNYTPFYKNFPKQVMEASDVSLWMNAMAHYWSGGLWEPKKVKDRGFAIEHTKFHKVELGTEADLQDVFTSLLTSKSSITPGDRKILEWFFVHYPTLTMPETIPFKETLCIAAVLGSARRIKVPVKTATDVLRIAIYMSGGDPSNLQVPKPKPQARRSWRTALTPTRSYKFKKFSRSERKYILELLDGIKNPTEDMWRYRERWLRLGEIVHPGQYAAKFKNAFKAFDEIRNNKVQTFAAKVEIARMNADLPEQLRLLSTRPGEFARRLDDLVRDNTAQVQDVAKAFIACAGNVSIPVLAQLHKHFVERKKEKPTRTVMIGKRMYRIDTVVPKISPKERVEVLTAIEAVFQQKFAGKEPMGNVWIDPMLYEIPLPFGMRSISGGIRTLIRGARLPFGDHKVIRSYVHWFDPNGYEDIDLASQLFDENFKFIAPISFHNLREARFGAYHSGDIRHRRGACAEYVDIDIDVALKAGVRYALMTAYNYNGRSMQSLEQCVFGWMGRNSPEANALFVPATVQEAVSLTNESPSCYIAALDLKDRKVIWIDAEDNTRMTGIGATSNVVQFLSMDPESLSIGQWLEFHANARGTLVKDKNTATLVFDESLIHNYDKLLSEYM